MSSKRSTESLILEGNTKPSMIHTPSSSDDRRLCPLAWNSFHRIRGDDRPFLTRTRLTNLRVPLVSEASTTNETFKYAVTKKVSENVDWLSIVKDLKIADGPVENSRWARSWANHRAQLTMLTRSGSERTRSSPTDDRASEKRKISKAESRSINGRSHDIELDGKAAQMFRRLRSIYLNHKERGRRVESIRARMNEFQTQTIRKEVNKRIQEFNRRLKEDEKNRRELRRVREKFSETKKSRLKKMHISRNALERPSVSRLAYGLPKEGKEFSVPFSSKKTTEEIKELWRTAIVRKNCVDRFLKKVSQRNQNLTDVTMKSTIKIASSSRRSQVSLSGQELKELPENKISREVKPKDETKNSNDHSEKDSGSLKRIHVGPPDSFKSLSSDEEDYKN